MATSKTTPTVSLAFTVRDLLHFAITFAASFVTLWQAGGGQVNKSALYSLAPAAATVAFRQAFPNFGRVKTLSISSVNWSIAPVPVPSAPVTNVAATPPLPQ